MARSPHLLRLLMASVFASSLAACGGGGGSDPSTAAPVPIGNQPAPAPTPAPGPSPTPSPAPAPTPAPPVAASGDYRMEANTSRRDLTLAQLAQMSAAGYALLGPVASSTAEQAHLYLHLSTRSATGLQYALDTEPTGETALLALLNDRGAQGYAYKGPVMIDGVVSSLLVRDSSRDTRFRYSLQPTSMAMSAATMLATLNTEGAQGRRYRGAIALDATGQQMRLLFEQPSAPAQTFRYEMVSLGPVSPTPMAAATLSSTLNQQGATGGRYLGNYIANGEVVMLFERRSAETAAVAYEFEAVPGGESLSQMLQRLNAQAAQARFLWGDLMTGSGTVRVFTRDRLLDHPLAGPVYP